MKQTMMGLLALMTAMLLSMNVQRSSVNAKVKVIENEMETIAGGVALEVLDHVGSKAFDAATAAGPVTDRSQLTLAPFASGQRYEDAGDIDDFHAMQTYTMREFDFDFSIDIAVSYVQEDDPAQAASSQTFAKKVVVSVGNPHMRSPVQLAHVYSYP